MTERLKPCPICGGYPAIYGLANKENKLTWHIRLGKQLEAEIFPEEYTTREDTHKAWNRRIIDVESEEHR